MKKITPERLHLLNAGVEEATNLMETLAIDYALLWKNTFPEIKSPEELPKSITKKMQLLGQHLYQHMDMGDILKLQQHPSDSVRSFVCYAIAASRASLEEKFILVRPFGDDPNSGVREWAWLALRNEIAEDIVKSLTLLTPWSLDSSPFIRRYAVESTRPRGVWCKHIGELRKNPALAIELLSVLQNDPHKYVQNSVANWLNDAGKDHPKFVTDLCENWLAANPSSPHTAKIIKRALRNLR